VTGDISLRLERLDAVAHPAAERFDSTSAFVGRIAVLPSAYNPPTLAHVELLRAAVSSDHCDAAAALLTTRNVDKGLHGAQLPDRVGMLLALHAEWPALAVAVSNQARIIDQAAALTAAFPAANFDFVVGFDTLERIFAARYYTDMELELKPFFEQHRVFAANRGAVGTEDVSAWIEQNAGRFAHAIRVLPLDAFPASLSSTQVRDGVAGGVPDVAVTPAVRRYIEERGLYR